MPEQRVIDTDGHFDEPAEIWTEYLDPRYHEMAPSFVTDNQADTQMLSGPTTVRR